MRTDVVSPHPGADWSWHGSESTGSTKFLTEVALKHGHVLWTFIALKSGWCNLLNRWESVGLGQKNAVHLNFHTPYNNMYKYNTYKWCNSQNWQPPSHGKKHHPPYNHLTHNDRSWLPPILGGPQSQRRNYGTPVTAKRFLLQQFLGIQVGFYNGLPDPQENDEEWVAWSSTTGCLIYNGFLDRRSMKIF